MKFTPASRAWAMMRCAVGSSVAPPNIMVPRQSGDTFRPLRPRLRYSTRVSSVTVFRVERLGTNRSQVIPSVGDLLELVSAVSLALLAHDRAAEPLVETTCVRILFQHPETQGFESARMQGLRQCGHQAASAAALRPRRRHVDRIDSRVVRQCRRTTRSASGK